MLRERPLPMQNEKQTEMHERRKTKRQAPFGNLPRNAVENG
jgi:hypothetical protein